MLLEVLPSAYGKETFLIVGRRQEDPRLSESGDVAAAAATVNQKANTVAWGKRARTAWPGDSVASWAWFLLAEGSARLTGTKVTGIQLYPFNLACYNYNQL